MLGLHTDLMPGASQQICAFLADCATMLFRV